MSRTIWIVVANYHRPGNAMSEIAESSDTFLDENKAWNHALQLAGSQYSRLTYCRTVEVDIDSTRPPVLHDWNEDLHQELEATRRHERELHSDWMASR